MAPCSSSSCADSLEATLELFRQHTGVWVGIYTRIDSFGQVIETHDSKLELTLNGQEWWQRNTYTKADGTVLQFEFTGTFTDQGVLVLDTPRLFGQAWKNGPYVLLNWQYKDAPQNDNHEMISLVSEGHRMRTWQCQEQGKVKEFVLIEEYQVCTQAER
jgi:hypothetical protein